ncbi:12193_t:CDS:2, partial [Gigaspora rosea]
LKEPKGTTAEKQADNKATNSALKKAQKCKPSKQATKSSVPNNQSSHETLSRNETVNQRYEEEDTTSLIGHKNNNLVSSQVSSSDNESDNGIYGDNISSPRHVDDISSPLHGDDISLVYGNDVSSPAHGNDVLSPAHRNISLLVHKNDISLPVHENNISLPNHGNDYSLPKQPIQFKKLDNEFQIAVWVAHYKRILDLATNIRTGMMTRIDKVFGTTSIPTLSHEPVSKFLEIDQQMIHPIKNSAEELYDELDEFVSDEVIKSILIAQDKNKDTQNAFENVMNTL